VAAEAQALAEAQAQQMLNNSAQVEITP